MQLMSLIPPRPTMYISILILIYVITIIFSAIALNKPYMSAKYIIANNTYIINDFYIDKMCTTTNPSTINICSANDSAISFALIINLTNILIFLISLSCICILFLIFRKDLYYKLKLKWLILILTIILSILYIAIILRTNQYNDFLKRSAKISENETYQATFYLLLIMIVLLIISLFF